jgi:hypothetical protein
MLIDNLDNGGILINEIKYDLMHCGFLGEAKINIDFDLLKLCKNLIHMKSKELPNFNLNKTIIVDSNRFNNKIIIIFLYILIFKYIKIVK